MAIRHREVFPEGSSPDSIDWRVWNDDHVGVAGAITQDQQDALDAANAPDAGNPFATIADVGGGLMTVEFIVTWDDLDVVGGGNPTVGKALHIAPAQARIIWSIGINLVTLFNDTALGGGGQYAGIERVANDYIYTQRDPASTVDGHTSQSGDETLGFIPPLSVNAITGADFILNLDQVAALNGDGTAGLIEIIFLVSP